MRIIIMMTVIMTLVNPLFPRENQSGSTPVMEFYLAGTGCSLISIWTIDLIKGDKIDRSDGFFRIKDKTTGQILFPHLVAEYSTGLCLITGAYGLHKNKPWGKDLSMIGLGALLYTSTNSLSWVLTDKNRLVYGIPMVISFIGGGISISFLL